MNVKNVDTQYLILLSIEYRELSQGLSINSLETRHQFLILVRGTKAEHSQTFIFTPLKFQKMTYFLRKELPVFARQTQRVQTCKFQCRNSCLLGTYWYIRERELVVRL